MGATPDLISPADREAFTAALAVLSREFPVSVLPFDLPAIDFAFDSARGQYASIPVLELLLRLCPPGARLLAVTTRDLFIPVLTFVFGHAQLGGPAGIVSLARLRQEFYGLPADAEILRARAAKEAVHETGHLFGLVHCADRACAMSLSTGVLQIDSKAARLCPSCAEGGRRRRTRFPDRRADAPSSSEEL